MTDAIALVAGATRGAGRALAVELARAGFHVYATGRSSRQARSEIGRPETIEDTGERLAAVGSGAAVVVDHEDTEAVRDLFAHIDAEHGRLDVLVNDMFGGDRYAEWDKPLWEHDPEAGWRMMGMGVRSHLLTAHHALPLMLGGASAERPGLVVEMTDGTAAANREFRHRVGFYYDLVKANVSRIVLGLTAELADHPVDVVGVTPGWLRSEAMLDNFGVTEETWRDFCAKEPSFGISESPTYVARGVAAMAQARDASRFSGEIITAWTLADTYQVTDVDGSRPDCWGHLVAYGWDPGAEGIAHIDDFR